MARAPGQFWPLPWSQDPSIVSPHTHHDSSDGGLLDTSSIPSSILGSGTPDSTTFLRGDRTWAAAGGGGASVPVTGAALHVMADAGLSLSDADPVTTWADQSGNGFDLTNAGGTVRPIFHDDGEGDGLPFVRFDGSNDYLQNASFTAPGTQSITVYLLSRFFGSATFGALLSCTTSGGNDYDSHSRFHVGFNNGTLISPYLGRNNNTLGKPWSSQSTSHRDNFAWGIFVGTYRTINGEDSATAMWVPAWRASTDYASAANFDYTHVVIGARRNGGSIGNWTKADYREVLLYNSGHTDKQIAQNIQYLSGKWGIPLGL